MSRRRAFVLSPKSRTPGKILTVLDAAKTVLRRRGFIVYDAEITEGIKWRGFVKCDQHIYTPARILAMAADIERAP
jgi:hypothetical protein